MSSGRGNALVRYGVAGLLAGLVVSWFLGSGRVPSVQAQSAVPAAELGGTIAFTSPGTGSMQLLYLVDTRTQSLAIYRVDPQDLKGTLKLEATRQYRYDLKLGEFNNQPPEVSAVESMVGAVKR
jgi:hypothetical protein